MSVEMLGATHGDERLGIDMCARLEAKPIDTVRPTIAHPEAATLGVRFVGSSQLMGHYPGSPESSDPEDRAAARVMQELGRAVNNPDVQIYDMHNSAIADMNFFAVGRTASVATIAGASLISGFRNCVLLPCPFTDTIPNAAIIEASVGSAAEHATALDNLYGGIEKHTAYTFQELRELYYVIAPELTFLTMHDIFIDHKPPEEPTSLLIPDEGVLRQLEAIPEREAFAPLHLPADLRDSLGVDPAVRTYQASWGHRNHSPTLPHLGEYRGKPRRWVFGGVYTETTPPRIEGDWAVFDI